MRFRYVDLAKATADLFLHGVITPSVLTKLLLIHFLQAWTEPSASCEVHLHDNLLSG